jgi:hypothetical protein
MEVDHRCPPSRACLIANISPAGGGSGWPARIASGSASDHPRLLGEVAAAAG